MILGCATKFPWGDLTNFESKIKSYSKKHSIRKGKRWNDGMIIHFATGVRTKNYREFKRDVCTGVQNIIVIPIYRDVYIEIDGKELSPEEKLQLAKNDGFDSYDEFYNWFKKETLEGQIVHWTDTRY